jgi:hypothetical protein
VALLGQPLRLHQPSGAERTRHVERGDEVRERVTTVDLEALAQLRQRAGRAAVAGEEEIDGAPRQTHQAVEWAARCVRHRDELLGQRQPDGPVLWSQEAVVGQRQRLRQQQRVTVGPGRRQLGEERRQLTAAVRVLGGETGRQASSERRLRIEPGQHPLLQPGDAGQLERRAVLVDPDATQAERSDRQRTGVATGFGVLRLAPELLPRRSEAPRFEQDLP